MRRASFSLTGRLTLSHLLATLSALLLLGGSLIGWIARSQRLQTVASLITQAEVFRAYALTLATDRNSLSAQAPAIAGRFPTPLDITVRIFDVNGSALVTTPLGQFPSRVARVYVRNILITPPVGERDDRRYVAVPLDVAGQTIGIIELSQSIERETRLLRQLVVTLLVAGSLALAGAAVLASLLARGLTRPLRHLGGVAARIAAGDLATRSPNTSHDEIGQLAGEINRMAAELQTRIAQVEQLAATRQQFYRSVSHELRTPLTAIRGMAENLEDDAIPTQYAALRVIQDETARLGRLVEELLQPGAYAVEPMRQRQPLDLAALARECCTLMQPRAARGGVRLDYTLPATATLRGDRDRLKQTLLNLLDNALKWTPPGGTITLAGERHKHSYTLLIRDTGPGIAADLRPHIWERGVHGSDGGQGLGLALVREVVVAHNGSVRLLDEPGTAIELSFKLDGA